VPEDAEAIHDIASACDIGHMQSLSRGFLLFPLSTQDYAFLAASSHPLAVCLDVQQRIVGFVCGLATSSLDEFCEVCQHRATAALLYKIRSEAAARGDSEARIVHQMALAPQSQGLGLGIHYFRLYTEAYRNPTYGVVKTAPTPNSRRSFWRALGFKEVGTIRLDASEFGGGLGAEVLHSEEWQWVLMRHIPITYKTCNQDQP
jgi:hypothetical protein